MLRPWAFVLATIVVLSGTSASALAEAFHAGPATAAGKADTAGGVRPAELPPTAHLPANGALLHPSLSPAISSPALTIIYPNGTISNHTAPISVSGSTYTVTSAFIGGILDERNGSTLNGANLLIKADKSLEVPIEVVDANNVTLTGINTSSTHDGVEIGGSDAITIESSVIASSWEAVYAQSGVGLTVDHLRAIGTEGVETWLVSDVIVEDSNLSQSTGWAVELDDGSNMLVSHVDAYDSDDGVYVDEVLGGVVFGNNASGTSDAFETYESSQVSVDWNNASFSSYAFEDDYDTGVWLNDDYANGAHLPVDDYEVTGASDAHDTFPRATYIDYAWYADDITNYSILDAVLTNATSTDYPLYVEEGTNVSITGTSVAHFYYYGMYLDEIDGLRLSEDNASQGTYVDPYGVDAQDDDDVSVSGLTATLDYISLDVEACGNVTITDSNLDDGLSNSYGAYLDDDENVVVSHNNLTKDAYEGLFTEEVTGLDVSENNASYSSDGKGFDLEDSAQLVVTSNVATHDYDAGLYLQEDEQFTVTGNDLALSNLTDGDNLALEDCTSGVASDNNASVGNTSLYLDDDSAVTVADNNGSGSYYGLYVEYDVNTTVVGNVFWGDWQLFYLDDNGPSLIYHNNFYQNSHHGTWKNYVDSLDDIAWSDGYPIGGNFWWNHTGPDTKSGPGQNLSGSDGIVDTNFTINTTMHDWYPLATPWTAHAATFTEKNLLPGTRWSVSVGGTTYWSTAPSIVYEEPDAADSSFAYTANPVSGYSITSGGSNTIAEVRTNVMISVVFAPANYTVTFTEDGLKSGTSWSVTVGSAPAVSSTSGSLTVTEINGTYAWTAAAVSGYALVTPAGNVTVANKAATATVTYVAITTPPSSSSNTTKTTSSGYSAPLVYGLAAGLVIALALAVVALVMLRRGRGPPPSAAQPWTPPPPTPTAVAPGPATPPTGGGPPPGASR